MKSGVGLHSLGNRAGAQAQGASTPETAVYRRCCSPGERMFQRVEIDRRTCPSGARASAPQRWPPAWVKRPPAGTLQPSWHLRTASPAQQSHGNWLSEGAGCKLLSLASLIVLSAQSPPPDAPLTVSRCSSQGGARGGRAADDRRRVSQSTFGGTGNSADPRPVTHWHVPPDTHPVAFVPGGAGAGLLLGLGLSTVPLQSLSRAITPRPRPPGGAAAPGRRRRPCRTAHFAGLALALAPGRTDRRSPRWAAARNEEPSMPMK
jgi:hypothetical protein